MLKRYLECTKKPQIRTTDHAASFDSHSQSLLEYVCNAAASLKINERPALLSDCRVKVESSLFRQPPPLKDVPKVLYPLLGKFFIDGDWNRKCVY